ncbi:MAG: DUF488 family protein [Planctomycetia bacterium]|nr:DUF488 family protein [Planctomycetia bacterium]
MLEVGAASLPTPERRSDTGPVRSPSLGHRVRWRRAYEPSLPTDGYRVLVDRLWPRGVSKGVLALDEWARDLAPSDALRHWFHHDPARWAGFVRAYRKELRAPAIAPLVDALAHRAMRGRVTLVFSARDVERNNAVVLAGAIAARARGLRTRRRDRRAR